MEVRVTLNRQFFENNRQFYDLERIELPGRWWFSASKEAHEKLDEYSPQELRETQRMRADLTTAIERS
jgi:hypothetical protein